MYGSIKFFELVKFEFLQKPQRHSKSIEIFNRLSFFFIFKGAEVSAFSTHTTNSSLIQMQVCL